MTPWKKNLALIGAWLLVALTLLLAPAPREWGFLGSRISLRYDKIQHVLQPAAHFILMTVLVLLLMRLFRRLHWKHAALYAACVALGLAVGLELLQALLPVEFARACDPLDLLPSLAGVLCGAAVGLIVRVVLSSRKS